MFNVVFIWKTIPVLWLDVNGLNQSIPSRGTFIATGISCYTDFRLDLSRSEGRLVALQKSFLDPATIPPGTFLTVTGEMAGTIVLPLDETEHTYPLIHITNLRAWTENDEEGPSHPPSTSIVAREG